MGLLLSGLLHGVLYMRELGVVGLRQWCGRRPGVQVSMSRPEMSFVPPALEIADLTVQPPNASEPLAFRNVRAGLTVFPLGISLDADIAGGELNATVIPSSLWNPERLAVRSSLSGVGIEPLLRPFMGKTSLVQIRSGKLEGSATLDLPLLNGRPEPLAGEGSLNLSLRGGVADLSLPMLKSSRLDKLDGTVETGWKKDRLTFKQSPLQFLLYLLDTIEPVKKFENLDASAVLKKIWVSAGMDESRHHCRIVIGWDRTLEDEDKFLNWKDSILKMGKWLDLKVKEKKEKYAQLIIKFESNFQ